jgi:hypothetical protein
MRDQAKGAKKCQKNTLEKAWDDGISSGLLGPQRSDWGFRASRYHRNWSDLQRLNRDLLMAVES